MQKHIRSLLTGTIGCTGSQPESGKKTLCRLITPGYVTHLFVDGLVRMGM